LTCDKAHVLLPWSAVLTFDENMKLTVDWYKKYHESPDQNLYHYTVHQIHQYTEVARKRDQFWACSIFTEILIVTYFVSDGCLS